MAASQANWFSKLFGFVEKEVPFSEVASKFTLEGSKLISLANNRAYNVGVFSTPSLKELREEALQFKRDTKSKPYQNIVIGDILLDHHKEANRHALFQVASQFNCLEFSAPSVVPEDGVTDYAFDRTQGPACSLACGAATLYRNYFVPNRGKIGQTRDNQINNLEGVEKAVREASEDMFWEVRSGYVASKQEALEAFRDLLTARGSRFRESLVDAVRIGVHRDVEVNFNERFKEFRDPEHVVSQTFCSAVSCAYSRIKNIYWEPLARIALDGAYEATLLEAAIEKGKYGGSGTVYLTLLGGGVFGNSEAWIGDAIGRAIVRCAFYDLDVKICHYGNLDRHIVAAIEAGVERAQALERTVSDAEMPLASSL